MVLEQACYLIHSERSRLLSRRTLPVRSSLAEIPEYPSRSIMTASGTATPISAFAPVERPAEDEGDEVSVGVADVLVLVLVALLPANPDIVRDEITVPHQY